MASARPAPAAPLSFWRTPLFAVLVLVGGALLAYHNSFSVPFVFDDELAIVANPSLRSLATSWVPPADLTGLPISGRPLVNFLFGVNYAISGPGVWSYHVVNLLVHVAAGLVFFGVMRRTFLQPVLAPRFGGQAFALALLAAALWTLHPLQTESVTYISQRAEALLGLLYLSALWCFIRAVEPGAARFWQWGAFAACLLGMLTKEVMVSAPLFMMLYDRAFVSGSWRAVWARHGKLHLILASTWLLLAWVVVQEGGARGQSAGFGLGVPWWAYLLKQCEAIVLYLRLSFWPHPLVLDYGTGVVWSVAEVWWQGLIVLALFGGTVWALVRRPVLGCVGAWFFMILAPSSSVVPLVGQTMAEHRMYLPLAAVVALTVALAWRYLGRRGIVLLSVAAALLVVGTVLRNRDYATAISICADTVARRPDNARAMALLADYHRRAGQLDQARHWLERSLELEPGVRPVLNNLGYVWRELGEPAKAAACFEQALALSPRDVAVMNNLGNVLILAGRVPEGLARLETALQTDPTFAETRFNLASTLAANGRLPEAAGHFAALVEARPTDAAARDGYGKVLQALGRTAEALTQLEEAVKLQPDDPDLHNRLGITLARAGRMQAALAQFEEALRLNPQHESARQNAQLARRRLGQN